MKRLLVFAAALSLALAPALSMAADPHKGGGGKPAAKPAPHAAPHATTHRAAPHGVAGRPHPGPRGGGRVAGGRPNYGHGVYHGPRGNRFYHGGHYFARVHGGPWVWPGGYGYHRFFVGGILPAIFLGSAYAYADYVGLGLAAPDPGFEWVRYGPDLVLVNQTTGAIVDVVYGAFL